MRRAGTLKCLLLSILFLGACATRSAYYQQMDLLVSGERYSEAAALAADSRDEEYGKKNALLYYLDRGMLLHLSGNYAESNAAFEQAKRLSAEYFTKSVTTEASTLLISDNMRPYYGEDFERALVNVFSALNYIMLGDEQEALVEARQADQLLKTLQADHGLKNVYKEDAFIRYLMGMLYENAGDINNAYISYRKGLEAYRQYSRDFGIQAPKDLINDALRTSDLLGFKEERKFIEDNFGKGGLLRGATGYGELVVLNYNGFSPEKIDKFFEFSFGWGWSYVETVATSDDDAPQVRQAEAIARSIASEEQVRMAFPKYIPVSYRVAGMEVSAKGEATVKGEIAEDIGRIAEKSLDDRIARIRIRSIVRAVIKFALTRQVSQKVEESSGDLSAWLAKKLLTAASTATELADKRSWRSLPDKILIARLSLPEGRHDVNLSFTDAAGMEISSRRFDNIYVRSGKKNFVTVRTAQ